MLGTVQIPWASAFRRVHSFSYTDFCMAGTLGVSYSIAEKTHFHSSRTDTHGYPIIHQLCVIETGLQSLYLLTLIPKGRSPPRVRFQPLASNFLNDGSCMFTFETHNQPGNLGLPLEGTVLGRLCFSWVNTLLAKGSRGQLLNCDDLYDLPDCLKAHHLSSKINLAVYPMHDGYIRTSLFRSLHSCFWVEFYGIGILKFIGDIASFCVPYLLKLLLQFVETRSEPIPNGYAYAAGLCLASLLATFFNCHFNFKISMVSLRIRGALVSLIYRKTLSLNKITISSLETGEIVNYMSTDVNKIMDSCISFHSFWSIPLEVAVICWLLYLQVGLAFVAVILLTLFLIPVNKFTASLIKRFRTEMMAHKDKRISCMGEILKGIKTIKLNVWESAFIQSIGAIKCLRQLAVEAEYIYPEAATSILEDFYVDDYIRGDDDEKRLMKIQEQVDDILRSAGFELHKWCANSETLISSIPREKREGKYVPSSADNIIKTLGLWWNPDEDSFKFSIELEKKQGFTKRAILSEALRLFDPLGLAGPVIVKAKIFLQQLWSTKIDWDTKLTGEEESQWVSYRDELMNLKNLSIPRLVLSNLTGAMELHGFCDSSERAYGAAIYVKTIENDHDSVVNLLCAKSRVAPLKKTSLPRLELCGALLLAKLAKKVLESITLNFTRFTLWSDSTIVLSWIKSPSSKWKTFVANRVSEIQALTS
ncbi:Hypothetical protein NTJ_11320 [Nesidiocoris tenuis]|uniref:ABC transmembrane type-1 domain-containing protein n=2 Tax=Nesidiocoris tenuis TaxID=355587 RepID=A0ABN7B251_9HEMI|nr:Hypothetical protein NTJ_11320 [Nesidiocoris tenuis]